MTETDETKREHRRMTDEQLLRYIGDCWESDYPGTVVRKRLYAIAERIAPLSRSSTMTSSQGHS